MANVQTVAKAHLSGGVEIGFSIAGLALIELGLGLGLGTRARVRVTV